MAKSAEFVFGARLAAANQLGTVFSKVASDLGTTRTDVAETILKVAGMSAGQFADLYRKDPKLATDFIEEVVKAAGKSEANRAKTQEKAKFKGKSTDSAPSGAQAPSQQSPLAKARKAMSAGSGGVSNVKRTLSVNPFSQMDQADLPAKLDPSKPLPAFTNPLTQIDPSDLSMSDSAQAAARKTPIPQTRNPYTQIGASPQQDSPFTGSGGGVSSRYAPGTSSAPSSRMQPAKTAPRMNYRTGTAPIAPVTNPHTQIDPGAIPPAGLKPGKLQQLGAHLSNRARFASPKAKIIAGLGAAGLGAGGLAYGLSGGSAPEAAAATPAAAPGAQAGIGGALGGGNLAKILPYLLGAGALGAGGYGLYRMMANRAPQEDPEEALLPRRRSAKAAFDVHSAITPDVHAQGSDRYKAARLVSAYLDDLAFEAPFSKQAEYRTIQSALAANQPLSSAIKLAFPTATQDRVHEVEKALVRGGLEVGVKVASVLRHVAQAAV